MAYFGRNYTCSDPGWVLKGTSNAFGCYTGDYKYMDDWVIPQFHKRSAAGEVFFNPVRSFTTNVVETKGSNLQIKAKAGFTCPDLRYAETRYDTVGMLSGRFCGHLTNYVLNPPSLLGLPNVKSEIEALCYEASTSVLSKRGMPDSNLFETFAERAKTVDYIKGKLKQVRMILDTLINGRIKGNAAKREADEYLAFRYGVKPLMNDIENVIKAVRMSTPENNRYSVKATRKGYFEAEEELLTGTTAMPGHTRFKRTLSISVRGVSLDEFEWDRTFQAGFSLKGALTLPYQLIPYSFVVDWFTTLGDFLEAYMPTPNIKQLGSSLVVETTETSTYNLLFIEDTVYTTVVPLTDVLVHVRHEKTRGPLYSPKLMFKTNFGFDKATRAGDAVALVVQRLLKLLPAISAKMANKIPSMQLFL